MAIDRQCASRVYPRGTRASETHFEVASGRGPRFSAWKTHLEQHSPLCGVSEERGGQPDPRIESDIPLKKLLNSIFLQKNTRNITKYLQNSRHIAIMTRPLTDRRIEFELTGWKDLTVSGKILHWMVPITFLMLYGLHCLIVPIVFAF